MIDVMLVQPWSSDDGHIDALEKVFASLPNGGRFLRNDAGEPILHDGQLVLVARDLSFMSLAAMRNGYAMSVGFATIAPPGGVATPELAEAVNVDAPHDGSVQSEHADAVNQARAEHAKVEAATMADADAEVDSAG